MRGAATLLLAAVLAAACSTGRTTLPSTAPGGAIPDLTGTWTGTWDGAPVTLLIARHGEAAVSGLYAGPWLVFGRVEPAVSGVLTSTVRGRPLTAAAAGRIERAGDRLGMIVTADTTFGTQRLSLTSEGADRLVGTGESALGARGNVVLTRTAR